MNDLEELKRLAQAATPGPWYAGEKERWQMADGRFIRTSVDKSGTALVLVGNSNADFIAAANPAAVLALIERVETLEERMAIYENAIQAVVDGDSDAEGIANRALEAK